jgi:hypothetical protein
MFPSPHHELLHRRLLAATPTLHLLSGPAGTGKTTLLRQVLGPASAALHWEVPPLEEEGALEDLKRLGGSLLGALPPVPPRPDLLPVAGSGVAWMEALEGMMLALARQAESGSPSGESGSRQPGVLALDGMDMLAGARRRLPGEILDLWRRLRDRGLHVHLVTTWRGRPPEPWTREGEPLELFMHPYRAAARAHGARNPDDAFRRWAIFGHHPANLPGAPSGSAGSAGSAGGAWESLEDALVRRVLVPGGDLHDAPLRRLATQVQVPRRYVEILASLAGGESAWGPVARQVGAEAGNRLAPYLRRLEAEGWVRVLEPLDGRPGGRRRRYALTDPFTAFWFGLVFPVRSLLHREDPRQLLRERIAPRLPWFLALRLRELARLWMEAHARERLPAVAREVGGLWAGEVEVEVAARLANGQVCYGICQGPDGFGPEADGLLGADGRLTAEGRRRSMPVTDHPQGSPEAGKDVALLVELERQMREVRWGMGREARAPVVFLRHPPSDELRRRMARDPLGRLLTLADLMGPLENAA